MFSWRAEMMAARSRAFMPGSGWPILAATVISRASLLNSFDFWASCRPLRCMMFLHWECPAMVSFSILPGMSGWKARRYRLRPWQNQRFAGVFGLVVVARGRLDMQVITCILCPRIWVTTMDDDNVFQAL